MRREGWKEGRLEVFTPKIIWRIQTGMGLLEMSQHLGNLEHESPEKVRVSQSIMAETPGPRYLQLQLLACSTVKIDIRGEDTQPAVTKNQLGPF